MSAIEAKKYPIYATQFHPEYSIFEWDPTSAVSHTKQAVLCMKYLATFFVNEARKNGNKFASEKEEFDALIYKYNPTFSLAINGDVQTYFFARP